MRIFLIILIFSLLNFACSTKIKEKRKNSKLIKLMSLVDEIAKKHKFDLNEIEIKFKNITKDDYCHLFEEDCESDLAKINSLIQNDNIRIVYMKKKRPLMLEKSALKIIIDPNEVKKYLVIEETEKIYIEKKDFSIDGNSYSFRLKNNISVVENFNIKTQIQYLIKENFYDMALCLKKYGRKEKNFGKIQFRISKTNDLHSVDIVENTIDFKDVKIEACLRNAAKIDTHTNLKEIIYTIIIE